MLYNMVEINRPLTVVSELKVLINLTKVLERSWKSPYFWSAQRCGNPGNGMELEMQMFPDDLPLANIDADGYCCHFMRSSVRTTIHGLGFVYCIQSKRLEEMAYNLTCWCIQMAKHSAFNTLVDTGDICCHYWQHILVNIGVDWPWPVWYKTKFGSQNLATKFGNHLCMATKIGSQC